MSVPFFSPGESRVNGKRARLAASGKVASMQNCADEMLDLHDTRLRILAFSIFHISQTIFLHSWSPRKSSVFARELGKYT